MLKRGVDHSYTDTEYHNGYLYQSQRVTLSLTKTRTLKKYRTYLGQAQCVALLLTRTSSQKSQRFNSLFLSVLQGMGIRVIYVTHTWTYVGPWFRTCKRQGCRLFCTRLALHLFPVHMPVVRLRVGRDTCLCRYEIWKKPQCSPVTPGQAVSWRREK